MSQPPTMPPIPTELEPKPWDWCQERCCVCRTHTRRWTRLPDRTPGQQVALCEACALTTRPEDVPTKDAWFDKERRLTDSFTR